eukprot:s57_g71.t1
MAGGPVAFDFAVTAPQRQETLPSAAHTVGSAAAAYAVHREQHLQTGAQCHRQGVTFMPMVVESTGNWDAAAAKVFKHMAHTGEFFSALLQELCLMVRSWRARAVLRRRGREPPVAFEICLARGEMEAEGCVDLAVGRSAVSEEPAPPEPVVAVADVGGAPGDGQAGAKFLAPVEAPYLEEKTSPCGRVRNLWRLSLQLCLSVQSLKRLAMDWKWTQIFAKHVMALTDRDHAASQDLLWTRALASWLALVEGSFFDSLVGKYALDKVKNGDREGAMACIRDACGIRSPSTVLKRAKDLQIFIKWAVNKYLHWWPLSKENLLAYLSHVEEVSGSKFIGKNLIHALKFYKFLFGAHFEVEVVCGPLLTGRVSRVLATRDPTEQARALTVEEVKMLETKLRTSSRVYDRYFLGCMLYALYSRARWGDMAAMRSLEFDVITVGDGPFGFVEGRTRIHKTSTTVERKAMFMPDVTPIKGVCEEPWGLEWEKTLLELPPSSWARALRANLPGAHL